MSASHINSICLALIAFLIIAHDDGVDAKILNRPFPPLYAFMRRRSVPPMLPLFYLPTSTPASSSTTLESNIGVSASENETIVEILPQEEARTLDDDLYIKGDDIALWVARVEDANVVKAYASPEGAPDDGPTAVHFSVQRHEGPSPATNPAEQQIPDKTKERRSSESDASGSPNVEPEPQAEEMRTNTDDRTLSDDDLRQLFNELRNGRDDRRLGEPRDHRLVHRVLGTDRQLEDTHASNNGWFPSPAESAYIPFGRQLTIRPPV